MKRIFKTILVIISSLSFLCGLTPSAELSRAAEEVANTINRNLTELPLDMKPGHARAIPFCELNKVVIGFANPFKSYTANTERAFKFLHQAGVTKIICLDSPKRVSYPFDHSISNDDIQTLSYNYGDDRFEITEINIIDWFGTGPDYAKLIVPEKYELIWNILSSTPDMVIGIHCGAGCGRTGTALTALKMKEMSTYKEPILPSLTEFGNVAVTLNGSGDLVQQKVYKLVENSIIFVRQFDEVLNAGLGYQKHSVETINDARTLNNYLSQSFVDKDGIISIRLLETLKSTFNDPCSDKTVNLPKHVVKVGQGGQEQHTLSNRDQHFVFEDQSKAKKETVSKDSDDLIINDSIRFQVALQQEEEGQHGLANFNYNESLGGPSKVEQGGQGQHTLSNRDQHFVFEDQSKAKKETVSKDSDDLIVNDSIRFQVALQQEEEGQHGLANFNYNEALGGPSDKGYHSK